MASGGIYTHVYILKKKKKLKRKTKPQLWYRDSFSKQANIMNLKLIPRTRVKNLTMATLPKPMPEMQKHVGFWAH